MVAPHTSWGGVQAAAGDQRCLGDSAESNSRNHLKGLNPIQVSNRENGRKGCVAGSRHGEVRAHVLCEVIDLKHPIDGQRG